MITNNEHLCELFNRSKLVFGVKLRLKEVSNADKAFETEIHLRDLVLLIINDFVIWVNSWIEMSGQESVTDIIKKLLLSA